MAADSARSPKLSNFQVAGDVRPNVWADHQFQQHRGGGGRRRLSIADMWRHTYGREASRWCDRTSSSRLLIRVRAIEKYMKYRKCTT